IFYSSVFRYHGIGFAPDQHSFPTRRSSDLPSATDATRWSPLRIEVPRWCSTGEMAARPDRHRDAIPCRSCHEPFNESLTRCNTRSEEHTSELQSLAYLVCRLLPENKKSDSY